jgi:hypothetical protein
VVARLFEAEKPAADIQQLSDESARLRQEAEGEVETAHHRVERALDEAAAAQALAEEAQGVLDSI